MLIQQIKRVDYFAFLFLLFFLLMSSCAYAGMSSDISSALDDIGAVNVTAASASMGQEGGFLTGGSGYLATKVKNLQVARVQTPSLDASCAGIDWTTGGISFIKADKLVEFGQSIMQNAIPFAVQLALKTWAPSIADQLQTMQDWAQKINNLNINSCEASQLAVGSIAGSFMEGKGKTFLCQSYKSQGNDASGWLANQQGCSNDGTASSALDSAKSDNKLANLIKEDRNIVWYQFMKNGFLSKNTEVAEYLMSLSGTIIYGKMDKNNNLEPLKKAPLLTDSSTSGINELLNGTTAKSKVQIYKCDTKAQEGCKNPTTKKLVIAKIDALVPKISKLLQSMGQKYITDTGLSEEEKGLLEAIDLPVFGIIQSEIRAGLPPQYDAYAKIVANTVLVNYLSQIINEAMISINQNKSSSTDDDFKWLLRNLDNARLLVVESYKDDSYQALQQRISLIDYAMKTQQSAVGNLSSVASQNRGLIQ
jgi:conjugative transfer pilus assembly protein TraH